MNKMAVFPITHDMLTVLKYSELIRDYEITAINSFREDILLEELRLNNPEINVTADINETLNHADAVLLFDNVEMFIFNKYRDFLFEAYKLQKRILLSPKLNSQINLDNSKDVYVLRNSFEKSRKNFVGRMQNISTPVITICGMGENCSKFETLLLTLKVTKRMGYKAVVLSGNPLVVLFGGYTWPEYLYADSISFEMKINLLNHDLYELIQERDADVIIAETPGGIMPLGQWGKKHFSEIPLVISNALESDIGILNTYVPFQVNQEQYKYLKEYCDYKYGIPIEALCMARQKVEYDTESQQYQFMYLDKEYYNNLYCKYCHSNIIKLTDDVQAENRIKDLIHLLEGNVEFI